MKRGLAVVTLASLVTGAAPARAQEIARCREALATITDALERDERRSNVWRWSWLAIGSTLVVGQAAIAAATTGNLRLDFAVGAATAVVIPGVLLAHPPRVLSDAPLLRARLAMTATPDGPGDPCLALPRARELLARDADDEALATGWLAHTVVIAGNVGVGLLLGLLAHDWLGAAKQIGGGIAVGEAEVLTLPGVALQVRGLGVAGSF